MKQPIFQSVFADNWEKLPPVMLKHYANRPFSNDIITVEGEMDVEFGLYFSLLSPFLRLFGTLIPYRVSNIPAEVRFISEPNSAAFCLERICEIPGKKPYVFFSRIEQQHGNEMIEFMKFGIGWRHKFLYEQDKVILRHIGYVWRVFGWKIPMPFSMFLGKGHAEEFSLSDDSFRMRMTITHPIFGKVYEYRGRFTVKDVTQ